MKHIILFVVMLSLFAACTKEGEYSTPEEIIYNIQKNTHRAVKISGTNVHWGEFVLNLGYDLEQLDNGFCMNIQGDTIGDISVGNDCKLDFKTCSIGGVIDADIEEADSRIEDLESRLDEINDRIDETESRLDEIRDTADE